MNRRHLKINSVNYGIGEKIEINPELLKQWINNDLSLLRQFAILKSLSCRSTGEYREISKNHIT